VKKTVQAYVLDLWSRKKYGQVCPSKARRMTFKWRYRDNSEYNYNGVMKETSSTNISLGELP